MPEWRMRMFKLGNLRFIIGQEDLVSDYPSHLRGREMAIDPYSGIEDPISVHRLEVLGLSPQGRVREGFPLPPENNRNRSFVSEQ